MHKLKFIGLGLIIVLLYGCREQVDPFELDILLNNGLEEGSGQTPAGWWVSSGPYTTDWVDTESYEGNSSITIKSFASSPNFGFYAQSIDDFEKGRLLKLSAWIKLENVVGEGVSIAIRGDDDSPNQSAEYFYTSQNSQLITGDEDWKRYTITTQDPVPESITQLTIYLILLPNTTGEAFFDSITLEYLD